MNGTAENNEQPAIPCGLVAKSFFNDTYDLKRCTDESKDCKTTVNITIEQTNIAWASDKEYKFNNIKEKLPTFENGTIKTYKDVQWHDMEDGKYYNFYVFVINLL
jgi:hypothetical protein